MLPLYFYRFQSSKMLVLERKPSKTWIYWKMFILDNVWKHDFFEKIERQKFGNSNVNFIQLHTKKTIKIFFPRHHFFKLQVWHFPSCANFGLSWTWGPGRHDFSFPACFGNIFMKSYLNLRMPEFFITREKGFVDVSIGKQNIKIMKNKLFSNTKTC